MENRWRLSPDTIVVIEEKGGRRSGGGDEVSTPTKGIGAERAPGTADADDQTQEGQAAGEMVHAELSSMQCRAWRKKGAHQRRRRRQVRARARADEGRKRMRSAAGNR